MRSNLLATAIAIGLGFAAVAPARAADDTHLDHGDSPSSVASKTSPQNDKAAWRRLCS